MAGKFWGADMGNLRKVLPSRTRHTHRFAAPSRIVRWCQQRFRQQHSPWCLPLLSTLRDPIPFSVAGSNRHVRSVNKLALPFPRRRLTQKRRGCQQASAAMPRLGRLKCPKQAERGYLPGSRPFVSDWVTSRLKVINLLLTIQLIYINFILQSGIAGNHLGRK